MASAATALPPTWRVCGVPGLREEEWSEGGERMPRPLLGGDRMPLPRPPAVGGDTTLPLPRPTEAGDSTLVGGDTRGVHKYLDTNDPFNKCFTVILISELMTPFMDSSYGPVAALHRGDLRPLVTLAEGSLALGAFHPLLNTSTVSLWLRKPPNKS